MTEFEGQVLADLRVLKSQMEGLVGIGQPGRICLIEERVAQHEQSVQRMKGVGAVLGAMLTMVHVAVDYLRR